MFTKVFWAFLMFEKLAMGFMNCPNGHLQTQYCTSEFVISGEIIKPVTISGPHNIRLKHIYKGNEMYLDSYEGNIIKMDTEMDFNVMSKYLLDSEYIIFGDSRRGILYADSCKQLIAVKALTPFMLNALRNNYYQSGCDCVGETTKDNYSMICKYQHAMLVRKNGKCTWIGGDMFEKCKDSVSLKKVDKKINFKIPTE